MGSFNKVLSFILGLVVVIVFIIILSRRLNIGDNLLPFQSSKTPTVTKAAGQKTGVTPTPTVGFYPGQGGITKTTPQHQPKGGLQVDQNKTSTVKTIPSTGSPTQLLLALSSTLLLGFYLRKKTN
jgi:hypothetical protein